MQSAIPLETPKVFEKSLIIFRSARTSCTPPDPFVKNFSRPIWSGFMGLSIVKENQATHVSGKIVQLKGYHVDLLLKSHKTRRQTGNDKIILNN